MNVEHITLANAAKRCPGRPSANAVWRWCRTGIRSRTGLVVRLEHIRVGGRIFTTEDALNRFFAAVAQADEGYFLSREVTLHRPTPRRSGDAEKRLALANKTLDDAGF